MGVTRNLNSLKLLTQYDCNFGYVMVFGGGGGNYNVSSKNYIHIMKLFEDFC